jgi:superfamily II DNA or RNA helicase
MTLTSALAPHISGSARSRGAEYFQRHSIVHFDPHDSLVYAVVRGTDDYVVRIELADRRIRATCTCPYFEDRREPCKHIWAVALECDAQLVLQLPDGRRPGEIQFDAYGLGEPSDAWSPLDDPEFSLPRPRAGRPPASPARPPTWLQALAAIEASARRLEIPVPTVAGRLLYIIDLAASRLAGGLVVYLFRQEPKQSGDWGAPKPARLTAAQIQAVPDDDRTILQRVRGASYEWGWHSTATELPSPFTLRGALLLDLLPPLCHTGRLLLGMTEFPTPRPQDASPMPLAWDGGEPFECSLRIARDDQRAEYVVDGNLRRGDETIAPGDAHLLLDDGVALVKGRAVRLAITPAVTWCQYFRDRGALRVPIAEAERLRAVLVASGVSDAAAVPEELHVVSVDVAPVPHLSLESQPGRSNPLLAEVRFSYGGGPVLSVPDSALVPTRDAKVMARRRPADERQAVERLRALGARSGWSPWAGASAFQVAAADVARIVRTLIAEGWQVDADGRRFRVATEAPVLEVRSGIDWFELHGGATFDDQRVGLPTLLAAVREHEGTVPLPDGTVGLIPDAWLRELAALAIGERDGDHLRFRRSQVALLDALLAARPSVSWDEVAASVRARLRSVGSIPALDPPPSFQGTLRAYQRDALGWLAFLRESRFGGCLADDMGLGKTIVVLALLEARRTQPDQGNAPLRPSVVVVPRSVLFNWEQEAARFAPGLRVLDYSGAGRAERQHLIAESDLVLVTYGTLRRDAPALADVEFDYVILDEAQAIKNPSTVGAKAVRLLNGRHRLALSGTPVENRVADLWSLFEFLNPGLLSGSSSFSRAFSSDADAETLQLLGRGLRPFILRRTKEQVASELPAKIEQTIVCELDRPQRALYNELRDHYRRRLLDRGSSWERSKIQVLEALLRLRQAACHPGLIDDARAGDASAKLDLLVPRLVETLDEGHKALVFSQFTSFLALLRAQLDERRVPYEYLDGRTRDRQARVTRFQNDPACGLFLISLKAGGVGLNLTAADYVFILDPWWNPAAEAQAVDRSHRIGQSRNVFAYRLIAKDTVEERVLELQQRKRAIADAIITEDNSIVRGLQREDLELLLS